jgi:hypothetical protein
MKRDDRLATPVLQEVQHVVTCTTTEQAVLVLDDHRVEGTV